MYLVNYLIKLTCLDTLKNMTKPVLTSATSPKMGLDKIFPHSSVNIGILITIVVAVVIHIILKKTVFGYELKVCGYNRDAAQYAGIKEKSRIVFSLAIAGALSGLGGALLYLAGSGKGISVVDVLAPEGFNGIPVALLGLNHPIGIIIAGIFISHLTVGGFYMQLYNFVPEVIEIIISIIIYFSAFALLIKGFLSRHKASKHATVNADGGGEE